MNELDELEESVAGVKERLRRLAQFETVTGFPLVEADRAISEMQKLDERICVDLEHAEHKALRAL